MKKLLLGCLLTCSMSTFAAFSTPARASTGTLPVIIAASTAAMVAANSEPSKEKPKPKVERRKIIFLSYTLHGNDLLVTFHDYNVGKSYTQKGCPIIINKMQKTFYVSYQSGVYAINCKNFK